MFTDVDRTNDRNLKISHNSADASALYQYVSQWELSNIFGLSPKPTPGAATSLDLSFPVLTDDVLQQRDLTDDAQFWSSLQWGFYSSLHNIDLVGERRLR